MKTITEMIIEGNLSFKYFAENIVKEIEGVKLKIPPFQEEWIDASMKYQNVVIEASRGHGKTITMGVLLPLYIVTYNPNQSILIVSPTEDRAFEILQKIKYTIENNSILKFLRPPTASGTWTKTKLDTSNHCQFYCRCMSPNLRGFHLNYLLIEEAGQIFDVETFLSAVMPTTFSKKGKCIAIGTPQSHLDLLNKLKHNHVFHHMRYPAIDAKGNLLWPGKFTMADLKNQKRILGEVRFEREYLLNILSRAAQAFPDDLILPSLNENLSFLENGAKQKNYFVGVDLASSPKGDYSVFIVLEQQEDDIYRLVSFDRMRGVPPMEQEHRLLQLCERFSPKRIVIDKSFFGITIVNNLRNTGLPVEGFDFAPTKRGMLLYSLQRLFRDKKLQIPYSPEAKPKMRILLKELSYLEVKEGKYKSIKGHDDCAISLSLAAYAFSKFKCCLTYGVSNSSIYKDIFYYGAKKSYREQIEKNLELLSRYKK